MALFHRQALAQERRDKADAIEAAWLGAAAAWSGGEKLEAYLRRLREHP